MKKTIKELEAENERLRKKLMQLTLKNNTKTIKVEELGIEVEKEIHSKGKMLKDIKIPEGWRLLTHNEIFWLYDSDKYCDKLGLNNTWEFIEQPIEKNKNKGFVARFVANSVRAGFGCGWGSADADSDLGVRFCRDIK